MRPPARRTSTRAALSDRGLACWLVSELLANAAWAGTLVYAGALLAESYRTSTGTTGCLLAVPAVAYVAGNLMCRRLVRRESRQILVLLAIFLALADGLFGAARCGVVTSTAILSIAAFGAGGRTLISNAFALATPPDVRPTVTSLRAATMQFGYFGGSIAGGGALAIGGYGALGAAMGLMFLGAAATLVRRPRATPAVSAAPEQPSSLGRALPAQG